MYKIIQAKTVLKTSQCWESMTGSDILFFCHKNVSFTGNLITMLRLLKNTTFSTVVHRASDIIKNVRTKFETSDTRLLDALCDVNIEGRNDVRQKYSKWLWRKNPVWPAASQLNCQWKHKYFQPMAPASTRIDWILLQFVKNPANHKRLYGYFLKSLPGHEY